MRFVIIPWQFRGHSDAPPLRASAADLGGQLARAEPGTGLKGHRYLETEGLYRLAGPAAQLETMYDEPVSPTVFRKGGYRFYFFSREETRMHIHVYHPDGEAKFWLEPSTELAQNYRLSDRRLATIRRIIEDHDHEIRAAWNAHFRR